MLSHLAALAGLAIASYTDLKETIVPDWLSYSMIAIGIAYHAWLSFAAQSLSPITLSLAGATLAFAFSYLLWRIGAWAGGDVKLLTGVGALAPAPLGGGLPIFPFITLANAVLLAFPLVMLLVLYRTATRPELRPVLRGMLAKGVEQSVVLAAVSAGALALSPQLSPLITIIALFLPMPWRYGAALFLGLAGLSLPSAPSLAGASLFAALSWQALSYGREHALRRLVPLKALREGMISAETLYLVGKSVRRFTPTLRQKLTLFEPTNTLASQYRAAGLEKSDIALLRRHGVKELWVKEGTPMVPLIFAGAAAAVLWGSLIELILRLA